MPTWRDGLLNLRDRLLASPKFQRWAAAFPLTRPIARRRARALFDLVAGFVYSQVLLACVRLDLFKVLAEGPQNVSELSARLALAEDATERLLAAAAALDLVSRRGGGRYGLGPHGAALLGNPGLAAMIAHHTLLYADLRDPVALLKGETSETALARFWPYAAAQGLGTLGAEDVSPYSALMSASLPMLADEILDAYPVNGHTRLLDVGGGEGVFLAAAAARAPRLGLMLFDLPAVAARAEARFASLGLREQVKVSGGDFFTDPLPTGADIITLIRVLLDHDDAHVAALLGAARRALPLGGVLLVTEPTSDTPGAGSVGDAYFGFYLLAMGRGRARTRDHLATLLKTAGFGRIETHRTLGPLRISLLVARAIEK